ncbi:hypothetical protein CB0940_06807 [Cercospora beticola]|uniref:Uncharacterized protein n=1 Tax=Cercospora beticola TaxID=122368 RepID=A0A2G5HAJ2_CERBT|nr:hypothetical protein CB0940_06807 [Cercospora beticola]PIA89565.1 hypothetical protein CB0940_06807 [Cercospora beticola]WPB02721.1 hypothetical protein RHO25_007357 [Cercospora beticola]
MATNTACKSTRRVYSAEELHRLRNTQSQPKLSESIEEHEGEDAELVKEHVLRGSKSFTARSFRGRQSTNSSLRVPSSRSNNENSSFTTHDTFHQPTVSALPHPAVLGEIASNGQLLRGGIFKPGRSPTPSLKKKAVEAIVKNHGSPSHIRVTAGGRIVPSEQSPLCQPRYGYSAIRVNGGLIKFAPNQRYHSRPEELIQPVNQNGNVIHDMQGNFFQIIDNTLMPLSMAADGTVALYSDDTPNLNFAGRPTSQGPAAPRFHSSSQVAGATSSPIPAPDPSVPSQIKSLEAERTRLQEESKALDQTEAKFGKDMSREERNRLFARRRQLVGMLDTIRKSLNALNRPSVALGRASPRALQGRASVSPPGRGRLPPYFQANSVNNSAAPPYAPAFGPAQTAFGAPLVPAPSSVQEYGATAWPYGPPNAFPQLPPFDGAMAPPLQGLAPALSQSNMMAPVPANIPQSDGAHSFSESRADAAERSHAVPITAPNSKLSNNMRSKLNPTSPAYKPTASSDGSCVERRAGAAQSPGHKLPALPESVSKSSTATDDTISPVKKDALTHSSSVSSFATADFFPRNPREHSTRQHVYTQSGNKENEDPEDDHANFNTPSREVHQPRHPDTNESRAPVAPPGTPVYYSAAATHAPQPAKLAEPARQQTRSGVTDRQMNNISPKNKRDYPFVYEQPGKAAHYPTSSPTGTNNSAEDTGAVNLKDKSPEWLDGYTCGLQRRSFQPECGNDWLNGYCDGLKASASRSKPARSSAPFSGSPMKSISRRPSPAVPSRSASALQSAQHSMNASRPPFETNTNSIDCLKQAIIAPHNENALLMSGVNSSQFNDTMPNLGTWAKKQQQSRPTIELPGLGLTLPQRNATADRQGIMSEGNNDIKSKIASERTSEHLQTARPTLPATLSTASIASGSLGTGGGMPTPSNRVTSLGSIESSLFNQWPGNRVMTPGEWRSAGTSQNAALTTGFFAHGQFDGTIDPQTLPHRASQLTAGVSGAPQRVTSDVHTRMSSGGRFREASLDGITSPPTSPRAMSPATSPTGTPARRDSKKHSPRKGPSPTKGKFESLAGKVGIKVTSPTPSEVGDDMVETNSPSGKRHWGVRDWIKGGKGNNA